MDILLWLILESLKNLNLAIQLKQLLEHQNTWLRSKLMNLLTGKLLTGGHSVFFCTNFSSEFLHLESETLRWANNNMNKKF